MGFLADDTLFTRRERAHATYRLFHRGLLHDNTQQDESPISFAVANLPLPPFFAMQCKVHRRRQRRCRRCMSVRRLITTAKHARSAGLPFQNGKKIFIDHSVDIMCLQ